MKERPILFTAPMVRAIRAGHKLQTRRLVYVPTTRLKSARIDNRYPTPRNRGEFPNLPPGQTWTLSQWMSVSPGDRLWVKETFRNGSPDQDGNCIEYRADRPEYRTRDDDPSATPWTPSIHMPRWASRITLEVTGVRAESLGKISSADALAEGVVKNGLRWEVPGIVVTPVCAVDAFRALWDYIHGGDPNNHWGANPLVRVIEFKRVTA